MRARVGMGRWALGLLAGLVGELAAGAATPTPRLDTVEGLAHMSGTADAALFVDTPAGRHTVANVVRCALPAGRSLTRKDAHGRVHHFEGERGFAPQWDTPACDESCEQWVAACLVAHFSAEGRSTRSPRPRKPPKPAAPAQIASTR